MKKTILITLLMLLSVVAGAHDFVVDGIYYNRNSDDTTVTVTYKGSDSNTSKAYAGNVTIPSKVTYYGKTYTVTGINHNTFYRCNELESIVIPNTVKSLGLQAFYECTRLKNLDLGESILSFQTYVFYGCTSLENITIPNSLGYIGAGSFKKCSNLKSIVIPNTVKTIEGGGVFLTDLFLFCKASNFLI